MLHRVWREVTSTRDRVDVTRSTAICRGLGAGARELLKKTTDSLIAGARTVYSWSVSKGRPGAVHDTDRARNESKGKMMTRNLKALGLAVVAVFAMSAVVASAASAQEGVLTVEGTQAIHAESSEHKFTSPAGTIECTKSTFAATVESGAASATITPSYTGTCTAAGAPATVDTNGCHFVIDDVTTTGNGDYSATVDIDCSTQEGSPGIVVTAFAGSSHGFKVCEITVPPQTGISPVTVSNGAGETVVLSGTATGIAYSKKGLCGTETGEAEYDLGTTVVSATGGVTVSD